VTLTTVLLDSLVFPEGPRWHDGRLWFSDMHAGRVMTVTLDGKAETIVDVPGLPSGIGWLPDGRVLVVSMTDRRVLRLDPEGLRPHADLAAHAAFHCNDMVVDGVGRAYVGNFGFDLLGGATPCAACLVLVTPDGGTAVAAEDLLFPNGTVITPDGRTLVVAETFAERLTAFDIALDGSLHNRRVWAHIPGIAPDGICLDAEGAIWVASPPTREVVRVRAGGAVTTRLAVERGAFACMLGGPDRRTLFILTAATHEPEPARAERTGRIETVRVEVPGAGWP
jgi:sugar lactone lactonase YvrE